MNNWSRVGQHDIGMHLKLLYWWLGNATCTLDKSVLMLKVWAGKKLIDMFKMKDKISKTCGNGMRIALYLNTSINIIMPFKIYTCTILCKIQ